MKKSLTENFIFCAVNFIPFTQIHMYKFEMIIQIPFYKGFVEDHFI